MNEITSSYRIAEMINSGQFQLVQKNDSIVVSGGIELLNLVPMGGQILHKAASQVEKLVAQAIEDKIKEACGNAIKSFYHKLLEEITEFVGVDILLKNQDHLKTRIQNIEEQKRDRIVNDKIFNWVSNKFDDAKEYVKSDLEKYIPHKYLSKKYQKASEVIAYRDSWYMIEMIGNGKFILDTQDHTGASVFDTKASMMEEVLDEIMNKTDDGTVGQIIKRPDDCMCGLKCIIF